jgi:hypothetical protein
LIQLVIAIAGMMTDMDKIKRVMINLLGLLMILFGILSSDPVCQLILITFPITCWIKRYLLFIHRVRLLALLFWTGFSYIDWQLAVIGFASFLLAVVTSAWSTSGWPTAPPTNKVRKAPSLARPFPRLRHFD